MKIYRIAQTSGDQEITNLQVQLSNAETDQQRYAIVKAFTSSYLQKKYGELSSVFRQVHTYLDNIVNNYRAVLNDPSVDEQATGAINNRVTFLNNQRGKIKEIGNSIDDIVEKINSDQIGKQGFGYIWNGVQEVLEKMGIDEEYQDVTEEDIGEIEGWSNKLEEFGDQLNQFQASLASMPMPADFNKSQ